MESDAEQFKHNIIESLNKQEEALSSFRNRIQNKNVVIFLGNTRSGKSTLVNYLIKNELEAWDSGKKEYKIKTKAEDLGPKIGHGSASCTGLAGVYEMTESDDVVLVDAPGFDDTRGVEQDIINALCINQIIYARTVKYVLVCDINEITCDNIRNFTNILNQIQAFVCNFDALHRSFAFIFTKDWMDYTQEEIILMLNEKIINQDKMDVNKELLKNLVRNKKLIGIFKMPIKEGDISHELNVNIEGAIKECHTVDVEKCKLMFAFSDKAKETLLQIYPEYTDTNYFKEETDKITEMYHNYFDINLYVFASHDNELTEIELNLTQLVLNLEIHRDANRTQLFEIQNSLNQLLEPASSTEFQANFKFVVKLDESALFEGQYKDMINRNYVQTLTNLHAKVLNLLSKINAEIGERRRTNLKFGAAGVTGIVGTGLAACKMGDLVRGVGVGGIVTAGVSVAGGAALLGVGVGSAYVLYQQTYGRRYQARREQGRTD